MGGGSGKSSRFVWEFLIDPNDLHSGVFVFKVFSFCIWVLWLLWSCLLFFLFFFFLLYCPVIFASFWNKRLTFKISEKIEDRVWSPWFSRILIIISTSWFPSDLKRVKGSKPYVLSTCTRISAQEGKDILLLSLKASFLIKDILSVKCFRYTFGMYRPAYLKGRSHGIRICIKRKKIHYGKFFDFCAEKCVYN